jgi:sphingolipid 4-desaturase/C4-monooxygenase
MAYQQDFTIVEGVEPHRVRTREILKAHPEVKKLISKNPMTAVWILACVSIQLVMAYLVKDQAWYIILAAAWFIGAFPVHTLFICIHEAAHNLIFKKPSWNVYAGIVANFPSLAPTAISFKNYHLKHHAFQGVHELDADLPDAWEAKLINNYFIGKALWLLFFPVFQAVRTLRCLELAIIDKCHYRLYNGMGCIRIYGSEFHVLSRFAPAWCKMDSRALFGVRPRPRNIQLLWWIEWNQHECWLP